MAKTKLTVTTDIGTFTRTTARTYTHLVVAKGYRAELLEAHRLDALKGARERVAEYTRVLATNDPTIGARSERDNPVGRAWDIKCHTAFIADGSYAKWIAEGTAEIARLEARGVITQDGNSWHEAIDGGAPQAVWTILGWCGRYDLALKLARGKDGERFRDVRIYTVVDGARVD